MATEVGNRIRELRLDRGMAQVDLESKRVSAGYISRIETGSAVPSSDALMSIAQRLGVSALELQALSRCPYCLHLTQE